MSAQWTTSDSALVLSMLCGEEQLVHANVNILRRSVIRSVIRDIQRQIHRKRQEGLFNWDTATADQMRHVRRARREMLMLSRLTINQLINHININIDATAVT